MRKNILKLDAWGLNQDPQLVEMLESRNGRIRVYNLDSAEEAPRFSDYELILASGALGTSFSDDMITRRISLKIKNLLDSQNFNAKPETKIYAFGKAAMAFIQTGFWGDLSQKVLDFRVLSTKGQWRKCQVPDLSTSIIHGLQICEEAWDPSSPLFDGLPHWATSVGVPCAWRFGESLHVSDIDFFALKETSLLPDYGYFDSSKVSTVGDFLDKLL